MKNIKTYEEFLFEANPYPKTAGANIIEFVMGKDRKINQKAEIKALSDFTKSLNQTAKGRINSPEELYFAIETKGNYPPAWIWKKIGPVLQHDRIGDYDYRQGHTSQYWDTLQTGRHQGYAALLAVKDGQHYIFVEPQYFTDSQN